MKIVIGADHGGFELKNEIVKWLKEHGHEVDDLGTHSEQSVDYPDFARKVAGHLGNGGGDLGILVCGTGQGMAMTANKIRGIRAAVASDTFSARMARAHNDANVLCLGQRVVGAGLARELVEAFITEPFEGGRHERRVGKIRELDKFCADGQDEKAK